MSDFYVIPQELKSQTKVSSMLKLYLSDLFFCVVYFMCFLVLDVFVDERLQYPYYIFNIFMALLLTRQSIYNPPKRIYQSLIYMIVKDRTVYHPISPLEKPVMQAENIIGFSKTENSSYDETENNPDTFN